MTDKIEELIERLRVMGPAVTRIYTNVNRVHAKLNNEPEPPAVTLSDAEEVMTEAADALAALRTQRNEVVEECARIMDERAAMYREKATKRDINAPDTLTLHECLVSNAESSEWGAAAIRNLKSQDEPR